jgi:hypothetical protein
VLRRPLETCRRRRKSRGRARARLLVSSAAGLRRDVRSSRPASAGASSSSRSEGRRGARGRGHGARSRLEIVHLSPTRRATLTRFHVPELVSPSPSRSAGPPTDTSSACTLPARVALEARARRGGRSFGPRPRARRGARGAHAQARGAREHRLDRRCRSWATSWTCAPRTSSPPQTGNPPPPSRERSRVSSPRIPRSEPPPRAHLQSERDLEPHLTLPDGPGPPSRALAEQAIGRGQLVP